MLVELVGENLAKESATATLEIVVETELLVEMYQKRKEIQVSKMMSQELMLKLEKPKK